VGQHSFRMIETNGITLRVVVEGHGPLLLLLHGFAQCWYLWRHQIDELVAAGYQVAVPDQRGYGRSDKPAVLEAYDAKEFVADAVGIADALGQETFTLVTHDVGAVMGWDIAVLHPERVTAVFALSVPPVRMQLSAAELAESLGDNFFHVVYFQQPGIAEAELDADVRKSLRMLYYAFSGDAPAGLYLQPKPASAKLLVVGSLDPALTLLADAFVNVDQYVTDLRGNILLDGAGHWLPLERTKEVNAALLDFLSGLTT
jgi:pimeloyl-ACP methyl ester carboxylesterase